MSSMSSNQEQNNTINIVIGLYEKFNDSIKFDEKTIPAYIDCIKNIEIDLNKNIKSIELLELVIKNIKKAKKINLTYIGLAVKIKEIYYDQIIITKMTNHNKYINKSLEYIKTIITNTSYYKQNKCDFKKNLLKIIESIEKIKNNEVDDDEQKNEQENKQENKQCEIKHINSVSNYEIEQCSQNINDDFEILKKIIVSDSIIFFKISKSSLIF